MALPSVTVMRLRVFLERGGNCLKNARRAGLNCAELRLYANKVGMSHGRAETACGHAELLREFPQAKSLLHSTLSRSLGVSDLSRVVQYHCTDGEVKKATITLLWPQRIEAVGFGSRRIEAERCAAAAACQRLRELGVLGPGNQLPRRRGAFMRGARPSVWQDAEEASELSERAEALQNHRSRKREDSSDARLLKEEPRVLEALSLFSKPKVLLTKVIQVATSPNKIRELIEYRTVGGKVKRCELNLRWPEEMRFEASAHRRLEAETRAAALACLRLKELQLLDDNNNPLTHARYHQEAVREAGERERRPCSLEIPEDLQQKLREYLSQYPVEAEMQKLWAQEEDEEFMARQQVEEEDEDPVTDAITGRPLSPLNPEESGRLSAYLLQQWERARPAVLADLPVDSYREQVVSAVESSRVVIVAGETGCGKTTRIPRFLLEGRVKAHEGAGCNILVTQPRRISAVSVAHRVSQEMGPTLRRSVGYQVRLESRPPERSGGALLFLTVGVLLRKLQSNPGLRGVSHVVVDEVHERDVNTDLLVALLRSTLQLNPDLRLVLMSATGDTQRLVRYFGGCPVVSVPGFMHPVREYFLGEVLREMGRPERRQTQNGDKDDATPDPDLVADVINHIHTTREPGALLCFLPGWQDIKAVQQRLEERARFQSDSQLILPLHSSMSVADQQTVFQRPPEGKRKIVLATNIAETSITIDDVVYVVDLGAQKQQNYDPRTKVSCLDTVWVSHSNVTQRRGRAGRCQPGHAYHLFPREHLKAMSVFPVPEILRTPLESLVVQAKIHCPQIKAVDFLSQVLDPPEPSAVRDAVRNLQDIDVLDRSENLTLLGERVARMSCDPRLGKVLVLAALFRCVSPLLSVAACLTRDPFFNSMENRAIISKAKAALSGSSCSDYLVFSRAVQGWRDQPNRESRQEFLDTYTLSGASLRFIQGLTQQFSENLKEAELVEHPADCLRLTSPYNQFSHEDELLKSVLMAGLYPNLIQVKKGSITKGGRFRPDSLSYRTQTGPVLMHRSTVNRAETQLPSRWLTFFSAIKSNGQVFIRDSSSIHPLALLLLTDCDLTERVCGDRVEVALPGRSLVRWELSAQTWELLWELRTSLQAMLQRRLQLGDSSALQEGAGVSGAAACHQDRELTSLLVELLSNTEPQTSDTNNDSD
ncbi:ATP-dependent RNA helicase DHX30 [Denticeps clupeoides]|uniref:ATP-dependent RNA helicase DHX30 n=1 Tax=Denticeps clupeoides TaxID=299321 RepID=A0AAY4AGZ2_9TELE|nr:ATP-dependent RNA helicase DHX30 [Denticeps clupeoides]